MNKPQLMGQKGGVIWERQGSTLLLGLKKYHLLPLLFFLKALNAGQNDLCHEVLFFRLARLATKHGAGKGMRNTELRLCCQHPEPWISYCSPLSYPCSGNNARGISRLVILLFCSKIKKKKKKGTLHIYSMCF